MIKITIQFVSYNTEKYLPFLFESLRKQTFTDWHLLVLDNGSTDRTVEIVQKELKNLSQSSQLIISEENSGFAGGHNTLFKKSDSEYVLLLNPDMYLVPDCLEKIVNFLDMHPDAAAVSPRLMKWDFAKVSQGVEQSFTDYIDSCGLKVYRSRRVVEWLAGQKYAEVKSGFKNASEVEVFGLSGALPLFRRNVLQAIKDAEGNIFDPLFFMYKEDVDLAFRLREAGYSAWVRFDAVAYHDRSAAMPKREGGWGVSANKRSQSELIKYYSYKNHLIMLYKNEYWQNMILDVLWIIWYEFRKFVWFLMFDRGILKGLKDLWKNKEVLRSQRTSLKNIRKISWKEMRRWWK